MLALCGRVFPAACRLPPAPFARVHCFLDLRGAAGPCFRIPAGEAREAPVHPAITPRIGAFAPLKHAEAFPDALCSVSHCCGRSVWLWARGRWARGVEEVQPIPPPPNLPIPRQAIRTNWPSAGRMAALLCTPTRARCLKQGSERGTGQRRASAERAVASGPGAFCMCRGSSRGTAESSGSLCAARGGCWTNSPATSCCTFSPSQMCPS